MILTITESQADILIRALANYRADNMMDETTHAAKEAAAAKVYEAIDAYGDNSKAYEDARYLAFQASGEAELKKAQAANRKQMSSDIIALVEEAWGIYPTYIEEAPVKRPDFTK